MLFRLLNLHPLFAAGLLVLAVTTAAAQQPGKGGGMGACRTDIATFCPGLEAGRGKRAQCLAQNQAKLSPECAQVVQDRQAARADRNAGNLAAAPAPVPGPAGAATPKAATPADPAPQGQVVGKAAGRPMAVCKADLQSFCASVPAGGGAKVRCLTENQAKLSSDCVAALASKQAQKREVKQAAKAACKADAQRLCAGAKGPERQACLATNTAQLSPDCAAAVALRATKGPPKTP